MKNLKKLLVAVGIVSLNACDESEISEENLSLTIIKWKAQKLS